MSQQPLTPAELDADKQHQMSIRAWQVIKLGFENRAPQTALAQRRRPSLKRRTAQPSLPSDTLAPWWHRKGATFCSLHTLSGNLRGCIGHLEPHQPLYQDLDQSAHAAAFHDARFSPLQPDEVDNLEMELSLIGPQQVLAVDSEPALLKCLVPGETGLIISGRGFHATFLPSVWESLPDPQAFVQHLQRQTGLTADAWPKDIRCYIYHTLSWHSKPEIIEN